MLDDEPDNDAVVHQAMKEGRLRHATVRQIDRRLTAGCVASPTCTSKPSPRERAGVRRAAPIEGLPQLAVLGRKDAMRVASVVTPNCHPIVGYPDCSLLFVHDV